MILGIDTNWTFKEFVDNIEAIRSSYRETIASFSYKQLQEETTFIRQTRKAVYSFKYEEWKKEAKKFIRDIKKGNKTYEDFDKWLENK